MMLQIIASNSAYSQETILAATIYQLVMKWQSLYLEKILMQEITVTLSFIYNPNIIIANAMNKII